MRDQTQATILVCEDDQDLLADLSVVLGRAGYRVLAEPCADAAIQRLGMERPDLILSDISMPGSDGMTFLHHVREIRTDLGNVPFVLLTAFAESSDIAAGKRAGADDYLVKPVDFEVLLATIEAHLRQIARLALPPSPVMGRAAEIALDGLDFGIMLLGTRGDVLLANRTARDLSGCSTAEIRGWIQRQLGPADYARIFDRAADRLRRHRDFRSAVMIDTGEAGGWGVLGFADLGQMPVHAGDPMLMAVLIDARCGAGISGMLLAEAAGLTPAEASVAGLLAQGMRVAEIATRLNVTRTTVTFHLKNIFQKTSCSRQADLIMMLRSVPLRAEGEA